MFLAPSDEEGICGHLHCLTPAGAGNEVEARQRTAVHGHGMAVKAAT